MTTKKTGTNAQALAGAILRGVAQGGYCSAGKIVEMLNAEGHNTTYAEVEPILAGLAENGHIHRFAGAAGFRYATPEPTGR